MILATFTWGSGYVANKFQLFSMNPYSLAFIRAFLATILFFIIYIFTKQIKNDFYILKDNKKLFFNILLFGNFGFGIFFIIFFLGLQFLEAGFATLVAAVSLPISQVILGMLIFKEELPKKQIFYFLLAVVGVSIVGYEVFLDLKGNITIILGVFLLFIAQLLYSIYSVNSKNMMKNVSIIGILTYAHLSSSFFLFFPFLYFLDLQEITSAPINFWFATFYVVIVTTILGLYFNQRAIKLIAIKTVSILYILTPIWGLILSYFVLGEIIDAIQFVGISIVLFSIFMFNKYK